MKQPILCYVCDGFAYFTPRPLAEQSGDDWNDRPYQHNASKPYEDDIEVVAFIAPMLDEPKHRGDWSVDDINSGVIAWLWGGGETFPAGMPLDEFKAAIKRAGGSVYVEER